ncbi:MAG: hypothetical protein IIC50_20290, partial [Planctomycetes bacterium]|nr:hypothetical protein [Planctomycetota bacterium]
FIEDSADELLATLLDDPDYAEFSLQLRFALAPPKYSVTPAGRVHQYICDALLASPKSYAELITDNRSLKTSKPEYKDLYNLAASPARHLMKLMLLAVGETQGPVIM